MSLTILWVASLSTSASLGAFNEAYIMLQWSSRTVEYDRFELRNSKDHIPLALIYRQTVTQFFLRSFTIFTIHFEQSQGFPSQRQDNIQGSLLLAGFL